MRIASVQTRERTFCWLICELEELLALSRPMPTRVPWSHDELMVAFRLYCRTPFGKLHQHNPEIIDLAKALGRTPSAVGMKACNFASLDPVQRARNISALGNVSRADRDLWSAFQQNPEATAAEAEEIYANLTGREPPPLDVEFELPTGPTEVVRMVRTRRVQGFFRAAVLTSYEYKCALSGVAVIELLNASHIIPWNANTARRADPSNGIALNALYDRAFDRGLITFDDDLRVVVAKRLKTVVAPTFQQKTLIDIEGRDLRPPYRFGPDPEALAYHRENIFAH